MVAQVLLQDKLGNISERTFATSTIDYAEIEDMIGSEIEIDDYVGGFRTTKLCKIINIKEQ